MTTEIKNHPTSTKHFIVINPTAEMVAEAKKMVSSGSARIEKNGSLTVHNNAKYIFTNLLEKAIKAETPLTDEQSEIEKMNKATWLTKQMIVRSISILEIVKDMSFAQSEKSACDEGIARLKNAEPEYLCNLLPDEPHDSFKARCILIENMPDKNPAAVSLGRLGGSAKSERKAQAVRENGKRGGRPPKDKSAS